jgi:hypothetical protein
LKYPATALLGFTFCFGDEDEIGDIDRSNRTL